MESLSLYGFVFHVTAISTSSSRKTGNTCLPVFHLWQFLAIKARIYNLGLHSRPMDVESSICVLTHVLYVQGRRHCRFINLAGS